MNFKDKNLLLIGGTGSFGQAFLKYLLVHHAELNRIIIFSRDEQKQYELLTTLTNEERKKVFFFIGDVRDRLRLDVIMKQAHIAVYAAAMKHVPFAEMNPEECVKTNILGTQNVVESAMNCRVEKVVSLSTDKAVMPINAYGASKLFLEKLTIHANKSPLNSGTKLCAVRYANVLGSRGSVVPFFNRMKSTGTLPITDMRMTRFSITMQQGIDIVMNALQNGEGGEVFVPKAPSYKITTVAEAIDPKCKLQEIGMRVGEKLSELMVSRFESPRVVEKENCYLILPEDSAISVEEYIKKNGGRAVPKEFEYDSATNDHWLSAADLKEQISKLGL